MMNQQGLWLPDRLLFKPIFRVPTSEEDETDGHLQHPRLQSVDFHTPGTASSPNTYSILGDGMQMPL
jgi:hypothetical protein